MFGMHGSVGWVLRLTELVRSAVVAHAVAEAPIEACGLIAGYSNKVVAFHPVRNQAASERLFVLDGAEMLIAEQDAEAAGHDILGVMHSHTASAAVPSSTDLADAQRFDPFGVFHHLIVSTATTPPDVRLWLLRDGQPVEAPLEIL